MMSKTKHTSNINENKSYKSIDALNKNINKLVDIQNALNETHENLIIILRNYYSTTEAFNSTKKHINELNKKILEINVNTQICIDLNKKLSSSLEKLLSGIQNSTVNNDDIEKYAIQKKELISLIKENYCKIKLFVKANEDLFAKTSTKNFTKITQHSQISPSTSEKTLLISEIKNKVILPYTLSDLEDYIQRNPGENLSIQQVIDKYYTVPLSNYKNPIISRFSEAYKLIRNKEHGSINEALDVAFEISLNHKLHPAIITACKNIDELDIYLSCLEYNELEDFKFFNINYEFAPIISKKNKMYC